MTKFVAYRQETEFFFSNLLLFISFYGLYGGIVQYQHTLLLSYHTFFEEQVYTFVLSKTLKLWLR